MMPPRNYIFLGALSLLLAAAGSVHGQQDEHSGSDMRIGLQAGVQTNLVRYTMFPYYGEFQSVTRRILVPGVVLQFRINERFSLQTEVNWWSQDWDVAHDGDPAVHVNRESRSVLEFPMLLQYRVPFPSIPVYLSAGPLVMIGTDDMLRTEVEYRSFTERGGWQVTRQRFDERELRLGGVLEIGLDVPLSPAVGVQPALRFYQPFSRLIDEDRITVRDFSYWRAQIAVLISI